MDAQRWEWTLPGAARVAATIDGGVESVFVAGSLRSKSPRGAKPEGHVVELDRRPDDDPSEPPRSVVVKFDPRAAICVLTLDGMEVSPELWPSAKKKLPPPAAPPPVPYGKIAVALGVAAVFAGVVSFVKNRGTAASDDDTMSGSYRAPNGRFVARFPSSFQARPAVAPKPMSGVLIEDRSRGDAVVVLAIPATESERDPWALHKRLHGEALANVPRANGELEETSREDGTCLGRPGALATARITNAKHERARVRSCAFADRSAGYMLVYAVREGAKADEEKRLARIVEATELTELLDMSDQKP